MSTLSLRKRLVLAGSALTIVPLLIAGLVSTYLGRSMARDASAGCDVAAASDMKHVAASVYAMCESYQRALNDQSSLALRVADRLARSQGRFTIDTSSARHWSAINQESGTAQELELPVMALAGQAIDRNDRVDIASPLVDEVRSVTHTACTIFQRMNDAGDMLRVATTIQGKDGKRAVGTYIPARGLSGPSPVVDRIVQGETYDGRAYVVDGWYATAYEPIRDAKGAIIGMLMIGVPEADATDAIRKAVTGLRIGQEGHIAILNTSGSARGRYLVSADAARIGTSALADTDISGVKFIQQLCEQVPALAEGEIHSASVTLSEAGNRRDRLINAVYFKPWDWLIIAQAYRDDIGAAAIRVGQRSAEGTVIQAAVLVAASIFSIIVWGVVSGRIGRRLKQVSESLQIASEQTSSAASQVSASSQSVAQGASEQAAALEQTTSALAEVTSMAARNADTASQASTVSSHASDAAGAGAKAMRQMIRSVKQIRRSAAKTAKVVKAIDEIAFKTNLLALNAAVEAARAGEAGRGFAVVADEVQALAKRSAESAKATARLIRSSISNAKQGARISCRVAESFKTINESTGKVNTLIGEIAAASQEQTEGISQVSRAIAEMDKVTQTNAAGAEESAGAAQELSGQAIHVAAEIAELIAIVDGSAKPSDTPAAKTALGNQSPTLNKVVTVPEQRTVPHDDHEAAAMPQGFSAFGGTPESRAA